MYIGRAFFALREMILHGSVSYHIKSWAMEPAENWLLYFNNIDSALYITIG